MRQDLRSTETATVPSSIYLTARDFDVVIGPVIGRGIEGLSKVPLYLMMKIRPPKKAPCGIQAGNSFWLDITPS